MFNLRRANVDDAALITDHRHRMFADNKLASEERYAEMDTNFLPWVTERLADGRYVGLLLEDPANQEIVAGAGIYFIDWPPHYLDPLPSRAYLLNFFTELEHRGNGHAKTLLAAAVAACRAKNQSIVITLHASSFGKPIYEAFGFEHHNEYVLRPDGQ